MSARSGGSPRPLFIVLVSVHGLIRGHDLELGRDADTGGQIRYVVELARALGESEQVWKVLLLTRHIADGQVSPDYSMPFEPLSPKAAIVRIECGGPDYLRKEALWDSLESFSDNALAYLKGMERLPDIIHGHYADAGHVGARLSHQLGVPLVFTAHSLGRCKLQRLLAGGMAFGDIEATYNISRRIEAEEATLGVAERIVASTRQEIERQYGLYDFYRPERMAVIPPGTDLEKLFPPRGDEQDSAIAHELRRFLNHPEKPVILALSRPDPKKNIIALVEAYGESPALQEAANLVIVAGNREDIQDMDQVARTVLNEIMLAIDKYDLYGKAAFPKHHRQEDVAVLYRLAASLGGVFVNPALTEPFGLTLIEAAASGLPIVATEEGGPMDIVGNCRNGYLIDPLDKKGIADTLLQILADRPAWRRMAKNGVQGVRRHYSWRAHVEKYLASVRPLAARAQALAGSRARRRAELFRNRAVFTSLDLNLIGDREALSDFLRTIRKYRESIVFGIATGRCTDDALATLKQHGIPQPDVLISGQGTEIRYAPGMTTDAAWERHIAYSWNAPAVRELLAGVPGLELQPDGHQSPFKVSYYIDPSVANVKEIRQMLLRNELAANVLFCFGQFMDVLPVRASKGLALRWCAERLGFPLQNTLVAGVTGADVDMLQGNTLGVVVDNRHLGELADLSDIDKIYFSKKRHAAGILEAMEHYRIFGDSRERALS